LGVAAALVKDASLGGAYLETTLGIDAGDQVLLELQVAEGTKILAEGRIVRVAGPRARVFGYGIQFIRLEDEAMENLLAILSARFASAGASL
jgi:Tfp pilus assembly protein PilZ